MVLWESPRQCSSWTLCEGFCWLLLLPIMLLIVARPVKLAAFPTSLSDCQTPTGWNCSGKSRIRASEPLTPQRKRAFPPQTGLPQRGSLAPQLLLPQTPETTDHHPKEHRELFQAAGEGVGAGGAWDEQKVQV